jgi:hypothetical protein
MEYFNGNDSHPILSSKVFLPFGKTAAIDNGNYKIRHIEVHHLCNIDKEIPMGYDTTDELLKSSIRQLIMDEVDVEGEPIFHSVERTMKDDTNRVLFTEPNQDLCSFILNDIETWMAYKFEHSDYPTAYRQDHHIKIFVTTTYQRKNQQQFKFGACHSVAIKTITIHVIEVVISITTIINLLI